MRIVPRTSSVGMKSISRLMHFSSVDFPAPDGPITPVMCVCGTSSERSRMSTRSVPRTVTVRSRMVIMSRSKSVTASLLRDPQSQWQRECGERDHDGNEHGGSSPQVVDHLRIERVLREDEYVVRQRENRTV